MKLKKKRILKLKSGQNISGQSVVILLESHWNQTRDEPWALHVKVTGLLSTINESSGSSTNAVSSKITSKIRVKYDYKSDAKLS